MWGLVPQAETEPGPLVLVVVGGQHTKSLPLNHAEVPRNFLERIIKGDLELNKILKWNIKLKLFKLSTGMEMDKRINEGEMQV